MRQAEGPQERQGFFPSFLALNTNVQHSVGRNDVKKLVVAAWCLPRVFGRRELPPNRRVEGNAGYSNEGCHSGWRE